MTSLYRAYLTEFAAIFEPKRYSRGRLNSWSVFLVKLKSAILNFMYHFPLMAFASKILLLPYSYSVDVFPEFTIIEKTARPLVI